MASVFQDLKTAQQATTTEVNSLRGDSIFGGFAVGAISALGNSVVLDLANKSTVMIQVSGTYTGALSIQGSLDGGNWFTLGGSTILNVTTRAYSATIPSASPGLYQVRTPGIAVLRVTALAAVTGTANILMNATVGVGALNLDTALPAGSAAIGTVGQNGTWSVRVDSAGNSVRDLAATAATITTVTTTSTSQSIAAANTARRSFIIENTGSNGAIISFSNTASAATRTLRVAPGAIYESNNAYTGAISAIQDSAGATTLQVTVIIT